MFRSRSLTCLSKIHSRQSTRCYLSHGLHHNIASVPRNHDDDAVSLATFNVNNLSDVTLKHESEDINFATKSAAIETRELLKQLSLSTPKHEPSGHLSSKAYDPNNTFPDRYVTLAARVGSEYYKMMQELHHIEFQAIAIGREIARRSKDTYELRRLFRRLFDHCKTVPDFLRVFAIATQRRKSMEALQHVAHPIARALFRAREHATDKRIYTQYYSLITRLEREGVGVDPILYNHCVKFAARSRDLLSMQRALLLYRSRNVDMGFRTFRAIIAKFSIGKNGYGEIRNGRWHREDLVLVLTGFPGTKAKGGETEDHHFGSFLKREHWGYVSAWVQILAHCRLPDELWHEWTLWRENTMRNGIESRKRDEFFISYMIAAGDAQKAWQIFQESEMSFWQLNVNLRTRLFDHLEAGSSSRISSLDDDSSSTASLEVYKFDVGRVMGEVDAG